MDIILLKLQTFGLLGGITGLVIGHSGQRLGILVGSALEEVPSVCALVHGGEILKNRVVVIAGLELESRSRLNDYCELTRIPCIVLVTGDLEADLIAAFYCNLVKAEIQDVVVAVSLAWRLWRRLLSYAWDGSLIAEYKETLSQKCLLGQGRKNPLDKMILRCHPA